MKRAIAGLILSLTSYASFAGGICQEEVVSPARVKVTSNFDNRVHSYFVLLMNGGDALCMYNFNRTQESQANTQVEELKTTIENAKRDLKNLKLCADGTVEPTNQAISKR